MKNIKEVASSFALLDWYCVDLGDLSEYESSVKYYCEETGVPFHDNDLQGCSRAAYEVKPELMLSNIEYYKECEDYLTYWLANSEECENDIKSCVDAICNYTKELEDSSYYEVMKSLQDKFLSEDTKLLHVAYAVSHEYYKYLNNEIFFISNSAGIVGVPSSALYLDFEKSLGKYIAHAEFLEKGEWDGYTLAFNKDTDGCVVVSFYNYKDVFSPERNILLKDTHISYKITSENALIEAETLAHVINLLVEV